MNRRSPRLLMVLAVAATLVLIVAGAVFWVRHVDAPDGPEPTRVLIVGDSVTQGKSGDWTWRYRLWKSLQAQGADVDFVGPRDDLSDGRGGFGSQEYQDPDFDTDHAARWGMGYFDLDWTMKDLVEKYRPDVVVLMLGINDFVWERSDGQQVLAEDTAAIEEIRSVDPGVDVVIGAIGQQWIDPEIPFYNVALSRLALQSTRPLSRVVAAYPEPSMTAGEDTYDLVHPSAAGEIKIAAGVQAALAKLGVGKAPTDPQTPSPSATAPSDGPTPAVPSGPAVPTVPPGPAVPTVPSGPSPTDPSQIPTRLRPSAEPTPPQ